MVALFVPANGASVRLTKTLYNLLEFLCKLGNLLLIWPKKVSSQIPTLFVISVHITTSRSSGNALQNIPNARSPGCLPAECSRGAGLA
jgi:hypothetical protein